MTGASATLRNDARILVIIVARIGDTLLVTPALRALKAAAPNGKLTVLAHPKRAEVLRNLPFIDQLGAITKHRARIMGWIGRNRYDHAIVYGHDHALLEYALRVSRHVVAFRGLAKHSARKIEWLDESNAPMHAVDHRALVLGPLGVTLSDKRLAYQVTAAEDVAAREWLRSYFKAQPHPLIALQLVSFPTKQYRDWGAANFTELMSRVLKHHPSAGFILLGGPSDLPQVQPVAQQFGESCAIAAGATTLRESAALIAQCDLYVGVDTGPTHLAGALGVPMVALYHSAHPGRNLIPLQNPRLRYIEHPATNGPGAAIEKTSMSDINVEEVWQAVSELLAGPVNVRKIHV